MENLDQMDRRLIALLKIDSRASITVLAARLEVSRATVQNRLERLVKSGAITRFTIELASQDDTRLVRAVMMIEIEGNLEKTVTGRLRQMPEIANSHPTNGKWDLIVVIETPNLAEFDRALREVRQIRGVRNSETSILLTST